MRQWQGGGRGPRGRRDQARQRLRRLAQRRRAWWWRATTTAACPRRCRTSSTGPSRPGGADVAPGRQRGRLSVEFGLYGYALSRYSGTWVGMPALLRRWSRSSARSILDADPRARSAALARCRRRARGHRPPRAGRRPALPLARPPSLRIESRLADKHEAVAAFARRQQHRPRGVESLDAWVGIVTCGKAHYDLMEVLRRLEISTGASPRPACASTRWACASARADAHARPFTAGLAEVLVIEEKALLVESQLRDMLLQRAGRCARPRRLVGSTTSRAALHLGARRTAALAADRARGRMARAPRRRRRRHRLPDRARARLHAARPAGQRQRCGQAPRPTSAPGRPHNTSTKVPEGSTARRHRLATSWPAGWSAAPRAQCRWAARAWTDLAFQVHSRAARIPEPRRRHLPPLWLPRDPQKWAVAAGARMTYKILFNDAVAMTGGQPVITASIVGRDRCASRIGRRDARGGGQRRHPQVGTTARRTASARQHGFMRPLFCSTMQLANCARWVASPC